MTVKTAVANTTLLTPYMKALLKTVNQTEGGTPDYGGGEKYIGEFANGKENGQGLMYRKDGSYEAVQYIEGQLQHKEKIIIVGGNVIVEGCLSGNCKEGASTLILPSGNKYSGNFANYQPHGAGHFALADGNVVDGHL